MEQLTTSNKDFSSLDAEGKMNELISRVKTSLQSGTAVAPVFYLFDKKDSLYVLEIKEKFLLKKERPGILTKLVKTKVESLKKRNVYIEKVLFLREGYYNKDHQDKNNLNLEKDFTSENSNEALIATIEDDFTINLKVFDLIKIVDEGQTFSVMSKEPIEDLAFCKIDPEQNIQMNHINIIE
jgi:hypothetical protein